MQRVSWSGICLFLLFSIFAFAACSETIYVVQNPDGTFRKVVAPTPSQLASASQLTGGSQFAEASHLAVTGDEVLFVDILPSSDHFVLGDGSPIFLQVTMEAAQMREHRRAPFNISIVMDRSGSMAGSKIENSRQAAAWLIEQLQDGDRVSLVSYASDVRVDIPSTVLHRGNRSQLIASIMRLQSNGGTFLSGGLETGVREVRSHLNTEYLNRVVLLSDGNANEGIVDRYTLSRMADQFRASGVSVTTMGVGYDYNEDLMMAVAGAGGGNYYFVEHSEQMASVFGSELSSLGGTVVRDVILYLDLPPGAHVRDVYGFKYEQRGTELMVHVNSLSGGERRRMLVALDPPSQSEGAFEISHGGRMTFRNEVTRQNQRLSLAPVRITTTKDQGLARRSQNQGVMEKVERVRNAVAKKEAIGYLDRGDQAGAAKVIQQRISQSSQVNIDFDSDVIEGEIVEMQSLQKKVSAAPPRSSKAYKRLRKVQSGASMEALTN